MAVFRDQIIMTVLLKYDEACNIVFDFLGADSHACIQYKS